MIKKTNNVENPMSKFPKVREGNVIEATIVVAIFAER